MSRSFTRTVVGVILLAGVAAALLRGVGVTEPGRADRDASMLRHLPDTSRTIHLRTDFASFYYAAKAAASDLNIYDAQKLDSLASVDRVANHVLPYLYPPFAAIVANPLARLDPLRAQRWWDYGQIGAAALACLLLCVSLPWRRATQVPGSYWVVGGVVCALAVAVLPFAVNIVFGQINLFVLLFMALTFYLYFEGTHDWLAGVSLAAAILIKVTPALLIVLFLFQRRWRVVGGTIAGVLLLTLATFDIAGKELWFRFIEFLPNMGYARNVEGGFHPSIVANFSLAGFLMRLFPGEGTLIRLLTMISGVLLLAIILSVQLRTKDRNESLLVLPYLVLMVIASPVAWQHHLVYLTPGMLFTMRGAWFELSGWKRLFFLGAIGGVTTIASLDFQPLYQSCTMTEAFRPLWTSLSLYALIVLFLLSLVMTRVGLIVRR